MNGEDALRERIDGVEKMLMALRESDAESIRVARQDVKERMEGFPAEYARKVELETIRETALRLDKTAMPREAYETAHSQLEDDITKLLPRETFEATLREWTTWRRSVDDTLSERVGSTATMSRLVVYVGLAATLVTVFVSLVILLANHSIGG